LTWAFATQGILDEPLLDAVTLECQRVEDFTPQTLALMAWSLAVLLPPEVRHTPADKAPLTRLFPCLRHLALLTRRLLATAMVPPSHTSMLVWAFAKLGYRQDDLLQAIVDSCTRDITQLAPLDLNNLSWGLATLMGHTPPQSITCACPQASIGRVLQAPITLQRVGRLFTAMASQALLRINDFDEVSLANMAWAFAVFEYHGHGAGSPAAKAGKERPTDVDEVDERIEWDDDNDERSNVLMTAIVRQANILSSRLSPVNDDTKDVPLERLLPVRQLGLFELWLRNMNPALASTLLQRADSSASSSGKARESIFNPRLAREIARTVLVPGAPPPSSVPAMVIALLDAALQQWRPGGDARMTSMKKNSWVGFAYVDYVNSEQR
jgi:hypothetical protein